MVKAIKDSEQMIVTCSLDGNTNKIIFYAKHKDVTDGQIPVGEESIGEFMIALARKKLFCKKHKCKLNLTTWEQVMA